MSSRFLYQMEVRHDGLHKYKIVRGANKYEIQQKANAQLSAWNEEWKKRLEAEKQRKEKHQIANEKQKNKDLAEERTKEAQDILDAIDKTLFYSIERDLKIDWEELKDHSAFPEEKPQDPFLKAVPVEPDINDIKYVPKLGIADKLFSTKKARKEQEAKDRFQSDHRSWEKTKELIDDQNAKAIQQQNQELREWEEKKAKYDEDQSARNKQIEELKKAYLEKDPNAIYEYCDRVLQGSEYPDSFPKEFDLDYNPTNKMLLASPL